MYKSKYINLIQHLMNGYDLILLDSEQQEIENWVDKDLKAINAIQCCTLLVCVDDNDLPNLTQDNEYKLIIETNRHYNIIDDNGNDVLVSKNYFRQIKKAN